ncbi:hypothetical protein M2281_000317 [Mesorhizobium soli]|uniref:hypothetical protein n=1 Tax=Pseudaminobacter soli (ex Li et al. 2025) TaxID=1295366 RepID=UPI002474D868|nr:hypothetical protein [Mesorhizobium soli]MDH6229745.1 hypothetical protein [Mesorhizobium soli]
MAIRHEVENLIRRGNIFYWRARVLKHGVSASHIAAIRANYLGQLKLARSPAVKDGIRRFSALLPEGCRTAYDPKAGSGEFLEQCLLYPVCHHR